MSGAPIAEIFEKLRESGDRLAALADQNGHLDETPNADEAASASWPELDPAALHGLAGDLV